MMPPRSFLISLTVLTILVLAAFTVLKQLQIPAGALVDWVIGISIFWWLSAVVTIPWNMHYTAKSILTDASISATKGIAVNQEHVLYAGKLAKRFFWLAIVLHICTAVGLYFLAYFQITAIGYWASVAALLLTFLRPLQQAYEHLVHRLSAMAHQVRYPRDDVYELDRKVTELQGNMNWVTGLLDATKEDSWASKQEKAHTKVLDSLEKLTNAMDDFRILNKREHELLARKSEEEMARLSEDAQFLNQVRDIIQFFKKA
ncbi:MAG: hypothetical protein V4714_04635 [Bacteroidota bacterium]